MKFNDSAIMTECGIRPHKERMSGFLYAASYGGGRNSTAMVIELVKRGYPLDNIVFSDPGFENPKTYEFITNHFAPWCAVRGIRLSVVCKYIEGKREKITDYFMSKTSPRVPDRILRDCTRRHKIEPIHKFYRVQLKASRVIEYIGFHAEESRRMKPSKTEWITKCFPLIDWGIGPITCESIIKNENLPVPPKSGCPNCFAASKAELFSIYKEQPDVFAKSIQIEENYLAFKEKRGLKPYYYWTHKSKPTRLLDVKKEFDSLGSLDSYVVEPGTEDDKTGLECEEGCMT